MQRTQGTDAVDVRFKSKSHYWNYKTRELSPLQRNAWYFLVIKVSSDEYMSVYLRGHDRTWRARKRNIPRDESQQYIPTAEKAFYIGTKLKNGGAETRADLDNIKIYYRNLGEDEIANLYKKPQQEIMYSR